MSTRSTVWCEFKDKNGKAYYRGAYCHFDGYLEGVGISLYRYWNDIDDIRNLIKKGDIRSIDRDDVEYSGGNYCSSMMKAYNVNNIMNHNPQEYNYLYIENDDDDLGNAGWKVFWKGNWQDLDGVLCEQDIIGC